jgi:Tfp pilus assembly protein PilN
VKVDVNSLKARFRARSVLAVTLRSSSISVMLVREENGTVQTLHPLSIPIGAEAIVGDPAKVGQELAAALELAGIRERRCVVCIPPGWALTSSAEMPEIAGEDLAGYLELRAEREFPMAVSELRLAHSAFGGADGKSRATIAAIPVRRITAVEQMLEAASCRAVSMSLGVDRCLPRGDMRPAVHFLANGNHVDVVITAGGGVAAMRSLSTPATPRDPGFDAAGFCREIRITLGRLPEPVRQQVRSARFGGSPASAEMLCSKTRDQLHRIGLESADCSGGETTEFPEDPAISAAEHYLRNERVAFEFLEPEVKRWQVWLQRFDSKQRRYLVGAAVALVILPILALVVRSRIESSLEADWLAMRRNVEELEAIQQKIRQFRPWYDPSAYTLELLEVLNLAFPDQGDVWAKSIQVGEESKVTFTGFARSQNSLMSMLERLRSRPEVTNVQVVQLRGDNPLQFTVTYKWEGKHAQ